MNNQFKIYIREVKDIIFITMWNNNLVDLELWKALNFGFGVLENEFK
jgi:hypothetical protein